MCRIVQPSSSGRSWSFASSTSKSDRCYRSSPIFWRCFRSYSWRLTSSWRFLPVLCYLRWRSSCSSHHTDPGPFNYNCTSFGLGRSFGWFGSGSQECHPPRFFLLMALALLASRCWGWSPCHHSGISMCNLPVTTMSSASVCSCSQISYGRHTRSHIADCLNTKGPFSQLHPCRHLFRFGWRRRQRLCSLQASCSPPPCSAADSFSTWTHCWVPLASGWHSLASCSSSSSSTCFVVFRWILIPFVHFAASLKLDSWYLAVWFPFETVKAFVSMNVGVESCLISLPLWSRPLRGAFASTLPFLGVGATLSEAAWACWPPRCQFSMFASFVCIELCNFSCCSSCLPPVCWVLTVAAEVSWSLVDPRSMVVLPNSIAVFVSSSPARADYVCWRSRWFSLSLDHCSASSFDCQFWGWPHCLPDFFWLTTRSTSSNQFSSSSLCSQICSRPWVECASSCFGDWVYLACALTNFWTEIQSYRWSCWFELPTADSIGIKPSSACHLESGYLALCFLCVCRGSPSLDRRSSSGRTCSTWCDRRRLEWAGLHTAVGQESWSPTMRPAVMCM